MPTVRLSYGGAANGEAGSSGPRAPESFEASPAISVLVAAQRAGVPLRHDCGGKAICGTCRILVASGSLSPLGERESRRLASLGAPPGVRLACQARAGSDVEATALLPLRERKEDDVDTTR